jgi:phage recombination protein Bet
MNQQTQLARTKKPEPQQSLIAKFAGKLGVEPEKMLATLRATAFRTGKEDPPVTNEEMLALLVVANEYGLNPFLKEIYAFRDKQKGGVIPIIGVDGYVRLMQQQPDFDGIEFKYPHADDPEAEDAWVECTIYRKGRSKHFTVREYLDECRRDTGPWKSHPRRMLRHRALIQCVRIAYGFGGVYDTDEGEAIALAAGVDLLPTGQPPRQPSAPAAERQQAEELFATDDQIVAIKELLAKTGIPDNLVFAKYEVGDFGELRSHQVPEVLKFVQDQAP